MTIRTMVGAASVVLAGAFAAGAGDLDWDDLQDLEGAEYGGVVDEMHGIAVVPPDGDRKGLLVFGDRFGQVHVLEHETTRFREVWVSDALRSAVSEVFVADIDADGDLEIVAYSEVGDIAFFSSDYRQTFRSADNVWASISAMRVANVDEDPQLELVFCAERAEDVAGYRGRASSAEDAERQREIELSRLHFFDCLNEFVEWESETGLHGRSIAIGDLDADGSLEVVLNSGYVVDAVFRSVQWHHPPGFGDRIGYADIDGDRIPELVCEYLSQTRPRRSLRFFDVDLQSESFLSTGR